MCREGNDDEVFATTNIEIRNRSEVSPSALAVGITTNARGPGGISLRGRFVFATNGQAVTSCSTRMVYLRAFRNSVGDVTAGVAQR